MKQVLIIGGLGLIAYALYQHFNKEKGCGCTSTDVTVIKDKLAPTPTTTNPPASLQPLVSTTSDSGNTQTIASAPNANPAVGITLNDLSIQQAAA